MIPSHLQMFDFAQDGFDVEVTDNGLSITEFVSDGKTRQAQADRNWQFTYQRKKDLRGDAVLKFPALKPGIKAATVEYKHYQDADLVALDAKQAAAGVPLRGVVGNGLRNAAIAFGAARHRGWRLVLVAFAQAPRPCRRLQPGSAGPDHSVLGGGFPPPRPARGRRQTRRPDPQSLKAQIAEIEAAFFRGTPAPASAPDLEAIARKWLQYRRLSPKIRLKP